MRDRELEAQLRMLTLQLENWKKLHDLITYGLDKAKPIISAEQERQFTEIRGYLLQETEHVLTELNLLDGNFGQGDECLATVRFHSRRARSIHGRGAAFGIGVERRIYEARDCAGPVEIAAQGPRAPDARLPTISAAFCSGQPDFFLARGCEPGILSLRIV